MRALWTCTFLRLISAWTRLAWATSTWDELAPTACVADCRAERTFSSDDRRRDAGNLAEGGHRRDVSIANGQSCNQGEIDGVPQGPIFRPGQRERQQHQDQTQEHENVADQVTDDMQVVYEKQ
jgi:hypothetical protein